MGCKPQKDKMFRWDGEVRYHNLWYPVQHGRGKIKSFESITNKSIIIHFSYLYHLKDKSTWLEEHNHYCFWIESDYVNIHDIRKNQSVSIDYIVTKVGKYVHANIIKLTYN